MINKLNYNNPNTYQIALHDPKNIQEQIKLRNYTELTHFMNLISERDNNTNKTVETFAFDFFEKYDKNISQMRYDAFLNDQIMQLFIYAESSINHILDNPRSKLYKYYELKGIHKMKDITPKTVRWISEKPGRNLKVKLAQKNKVLVQNKDYTINTKENQVLYAVLTKFYKYFRLIVDGDYFKKTGMYYGKALKFIKKYNQLKRTIFFDMKIVNHSTPNNILQGDLKYKVIWNVYVEFKRFNLYITDDLLLKMNANYLYWSILYSFYKKEGLKYRNSTISTGKYNYEDVSFYYKTHSQKFKTRIQLKKDNTIVIQRFTEHVVGAKVQNALDISNNIVFLAINENGNLILNMKHSTQKELHLSIEGLNKICRELLELYIPNTILPDDEFLSLNLIEKKRLPFIETARGRMRFISDNDQSDIVIKLDKKSYSLTNRMMNDYSLLTTTNKGLYDADERNLYSHFCQEIKKYSVSDVVYSLSDSYDYFELKKINGTMNMLGTPIPIWSSVIAAHSLNEKRGQFFFMNLYDYVTVVVKLELENKKVYRYQPVVTEKNLSVYENVYIPYLDECLLKQKIDVDKTTYHNLLYSGAIEHFLESKRNYEFYLNNDDFSEKIILLYDPELHLQLIQKYNKLVQDNLPQGKTLLIANNTINLKRNDNCTILNQESFYKGLSIVRTKISNNQVIWIDFMPKLELEVISGIDTYGFVQLISNNSKLIYDKNSRNKVFENKDQVLTLPKQKDKISFLLYKQEFTKSKQYEATINLKGNALTKEETCYPKIIYSSGSEYPFTLYLVNEAGKEYEVEWTVKEFLNISNATKYETKKRDTDIAKIVNNIIVYFNNIDTLFANSNALFTLANSIQETISFDSKNSKELFTKNKNVIIKFFNIFLDIVEEIEQMSQPPQGYKKVISNGFQVLYSLYFLLEDTDTELRILSRNETTSFFRMIPFSSAVKQVLLVQRLLKNSVKTNVIKELLSAACVDDLLFRNMYSINKSLVYDILALIKLQLSSKLLSKLKVETYRMFILSTELLYTMLTIRHDDAQFMSVDDIITKDLIYILKKISFVFNNEDIIQLEKEYNQSLPNRKIGFILSNEDRKILYDGLENVHELIKILVLALSNDIDLPDIKTVVK